MPNHDTPHVLIVDDDLTVGLLASETLTQAGFRVTLAQNGAEAHAMLGQSRPDIVLLDVQLPDTNGITLCGELRATAAHADTPILMITGADDHDSILAAYGAGATDFMPKPLNWYLLVQRVRYMWRSNQILNAARENERLLSQAQMMAMIGNWEKNLSTGRITTSPQFRHLFGNPEWSEEDSFLPFLDAIPGDEQALVARAIDHAGSSGQGRTFEHRILRSNGTPRHVRHTLEVRRDTDNTPTSICGILQDITVDKLRSQLQADRNDILEHILKHPDMAELYHGLRALLARQIPNTELGIAVSTPQGWRYSHRPLEHAFLDATTFPADVEDAIIRSLKTDARRPLDFSLHDLASTNTLFETLVVLPVQAGAEETPGTLLCLFLPTGTIRPKHGLYLELLQTMSSIAAVALENFRLSTELRDQAFRDHLTGLNNRFFFLDRLEHILAEAKQFNQQRALIFLDIDRFKHTNDLLGHSFGDMILREVALRLRAITRESDTLTRMSGDEFMLISSPLNTGQEAQELCARIMHTMSAPFEILDYSLNLGFSIGVSLYPQDGEQPEVLYQNADIAIYYAKKSGGNVIKFYDHTIMNQFLEKLSLENDMARALTEEEFTLVFQPQVRTASGTVAGYETLLRWRKPDGEIIPPSTFIPIAEENGFIVRLGYWVLEKACTMFRALHDSGHETVRLAVNVSTVQFVQDNFPDQVRQVLAKTGFPPRLLELEVTESAVMDDIDVVAARLNQLRALGITVAIDDFGTGYSSISYLKSLPIDCLKIDRNFITPIGSEQPDHEKSAALVDALIKLAATLGLDVVAEGVETAEQLDFLRRKGCAFVQGYFTGRPAPLEEHYPEITL